MAITTPILGATSVRTGLTVTLTNDTSGGLWSSSDTGVCTIDAASGLVTGIAQGTCTIVYTIGSDSIAETFTVYQATITNGFDLYRLMQTTALKGRLGWKQPTGTNIPNIPTLSTANKMATSGRYYGSQFHKGATLVNYFNTQENLDISADDFNQLLQDEEQAVVMRLLNAVFNRPALIEHCANYTRQANIRNIIIPNGGNFCGYRINVAEGNYAVNIDNIGMAFDGAVTFNMYLFNDLILRPVYTKSVTSQPFTQVRVQLDWVMNFINSTNSGNLGGVWYLGYFQDDLGGVKALDEQLNLWADSKIFGAYPFQSPKIGLLDFNRRQPSVNFRSYGFNFEASSYRDYTQVIVQNANMFDEARGLAMAINVLEQVQFTTQTNSTQRQISEALDKYSKDLNIPESSITPNPFLSGLDVQLQREIQRLNDNFWRKAQAMSVPIGGGDWWNEGYYEGMDINNLPSRENAY